MWGGVGLTRQVHIHSIGDSAVEMGAGECVFHGGSVTLLIVCRAGTAALGGWCTWNLSEDDCSSGRHGYENVPLQKSQALAMQHME